MKRVSAQDIQDRIFRNMSADERVKVGAQLWVLAKDLVGNKIDYARSRPKTTSHKSYPGS